MWISPDRPLLGRGNRKYRSHPSHATEGLFLKGGGGRIDFDPFLLSNPCSQRYPRIQQEQPAHPFLPPSHPSTCHHQGEIKAPFHRFPVDLIREGCKTHIFFIVLGEKETKSTVGGKARVWGETGFPGFWERDSPHGGGGRVGPGGGTTGPPHRTRRGPAAPRGFWAGRGWRGPEGRCAGA